MICVVIGRPRHKMMQIEVEEAGKRGAKMIELRLDFLAKAPNFQRLLVSKPCAMLATVRRQEDGGRWNGNEDQRRMILRQATVAGFDWVDIEMDVAKEIRRYKDVKRIISYHNLREFPQNIEEIYAEMCELDADIVKLAVVAQQPTDNLRILELVKEQRRPTVAHCMGDQGFPSRILGAKYGAPFTYAAFNRERGLAPGMPSFDELKNIYRYDQVQADTQVFGVIGDPVAHSLSPLIHNAALRQAGVNGVYLPFRVPRGTLGPFLQAFERLPVQGYSVTIPHKEAAAGAAKVKEDAVVLVRAANTLVRGKDGFTAYNTDYQAARSTLLENLPRGEDGQPVPLSSKTVLLLGAGGVARALAHLCQREGAKLIITNRTPDRAQQLAEEVGCRFVDWGGRHSVLCDLLVNGTSVGMHPNVDDSPIHPSFFKPGLMVFETIYTPESTLLVKEARSRGCHVVTGVEMFVRQAALQFRLFTGQDAPLDSMRDSVKRALSPVKLSDETPPPEVPEPRA